MKINNYRKMLNKPSKMGNIKVFYDGKWFDSKGECNHYKLLMVLEKAGEIYDIRCQVRFKLVPAVYHHESEFEYDYEKFTFEKLNKHYKCVSREKSFTVDFVFFKTVNSIPVKVVRDYKPKFKNESYRKTKAWIKFKQQSRLMKTVYGIDVEVA